MKPEYIQRRPLAAITGVQVIHQFAYIRRPDGGGVDLVLNTSVGTEEAGHFKRWSVKKDDVVFALARDGSVHLGKWEYHNQRQYQQLSIEFNLPGGEYLTLYTALNYYFYESGWRSALIDIANYQLPSGHVISDKYQHRSIHINQRGDTREVYK